MLVLAGMAALSASEKAWGQIPDLLTAFDAGGRAMGMGGSIYGSSSETLSSFYNPAGLGFIDSPVFATAIRNKPNSANRITGGTLSNPIRSTKNGFGSLGLTHAGYAAPWRSGGQRKGTFALSYTTGGYIRDEATSNEVVVNASLSWRNYREISKAQTDYFTVAYGWPSRDGQTTYGAGVTVASQYILNRQEYTPVTGGTAGSPNISDRSGTGIGVGLVAGVQIVPKDRPNLVIGLSGRTPIDISENASTNSYYDRIPGKLTASVAVRRDGIRGGRDFVVYGAQVDGYFGGQRGATFSRKEGVAGGAGLEYNYATDRARVPIRLGFNAVPAMGDGFRERSALTFGIGYRPYNQPLAIDFNVASPTGGGRMDTALAITYRPRQ